jgi:hypothetical protein
MNMSWEETGRVRDLEEAGQSGKTPRNAETK